MGRDEADVRPFGELGEELEPRASGQLDIEEEDVGGTVLEEFACLRDAPRGAEHLDLAVGGEEVGETQARRGLVVDEEGRGHRGNLSGRGDLRIPSGAGRLTTGEAFSVDFPPGRITGRRPRQVFHTPGRLSGRH